jgi:hypothetical protein
MRNVLRPLLSLDKLESVLDGPPIFRLGVHSFFATGPFASPGAKVTGTIITIDR